MNKKKKREVKRRSRSNRAELLVDRLRRGSILRTQLRILPKSILQAEPVDHIDVVFNILRSRIDKEPVSLPDHLAFEQIMQVGMPPNVIRLKVLPGQLGSPQNSPVVIRSYGERPNFIKFVLRKADDVPVAVYAPKFPNPDADLVPYTPGGANDLNNVKDILSMEDLIQERIIELNSLQGPIKKHKEYFFTLDIHTSTLLWMDLGRDATEELLEPFGLVDDHLSLATDINDITSRLDERVRYRANDWLTHVRQFEFLEKTPFDQATRLSELLIAIEGRVLDSTEDLSDAVGAFCGGTLKSQRASLAVDYQPRSGYYYLFGEFALLAIENAINPNHWLHEHRARALIRNQPVFAESYGGGDTLGPADPDGWVMNPINKGFTDYSPETFHGTAQDPWLMEAYDFATLDPEWLEQQAAENAYAYLSGVAPP